MARKCECSECSTIAVSIPGSKHRRCKRAKDAGIKDKREERLSYRDRGTWQAVA